MSITIRQGEGTRTTTRSIAGIAGGVLSVTVGNLSATVTPGDIVELFGTGGAGNDGFYTVTAINTAPNPDTYVLRPAPNNQGAGGTAVRLNRAPTKTIDASGVTSVQALAGTGGYAVLQVTGANFITRGVRPSDRVALTGSSTAANNGAWIVHKVLEEDKLVVRAPDGGAGMTTEAVGTGTVSVRIGVYRMLITNEASLSWSTIATSGAPLAAPGGLNFAGGTMRDYVQIEQVAGNVANTTSRTLVRLHGISRIDVDQSGLAGGSDWTSLEEVVVSTPSVASGQISGGNDFGMCLITPVTTGWAGPLHLQLGLPGTDRYDATSGSAWIGVRWDAINAAGFDSGGRGRVSAYMSFWDAVSGITDASSQGRLLWLSALGNATAVVAKSGLGISNGQVTAVATVNAFLAQSAAADTENILLCGDGDFTTIAMAVSGTFIGMRFAGDVIGFPPVYSNSAAMLVLQDPAEDYSLIDVVENATGSANAEKRYTYDPRYVMPGTDVDPDPVVGLTVEIYELNQITQAQVLLATLVTDAQGGHASQILRREALSPTEVSTLYSHKIRTYGAGFPVTDHYIEMTSKFTGDFPIGGFSGDMLGLPPVVRVATVPVAVAVRTPVVRVDPETSEVEVVPL